MPGLGETAIGAYMQGYNFMDRIEGRKQAPPTLTPNENDNADAKEKKPARGIEPERDEFDEAFDAALEEQSGPSETKTPEPTEKKRHQAIPRFLPTPL